MKLLENYIKEIDLALEEINELFAKYKIDYCIIGGTALSKYRYTRQTDDIDILISSHDIEKLNNLPIGYIRKVTKKVFKLHNPEAKVEIIFSGERAGDNRGIDYVEPIGISIMDKKTGAYIISLPYLVAYKLSAGIYGKRLKDFGDVQELIMRNKLPIDYLDGDFREDIVAKYREIWELSK